MTLTKATLIAGLLALGPAPALAWNDIYTGDGTTRAGKTLVYPYPGVANFCPAGLQPVLANGEICCGTPNTTARFHNAPGGRKHLAKRRAHAPKAYAPEGYKGVIYK
ncbi:MULTISPECIES: hypothetical protein [Marinovum]|uniref:hypothetical protein n=1 Tax=Marinovum TaxID=367771 RepID=UPI00237B536D|nr:MULTISPECIES: hypothetical protein [Marinovum]MDD9741176.1 hypothetical protein [Marinovum sp. SP66]